MRSVHDDHAPSAEKANRDEWGPAGTGNEAAVDSRHERAERPDTERAGERATSDRAAGREQRG